MIQEYGIIFVFLFFNQKKVVSIKKHIFNPIFFLIQPNKKVFEFKNIIVSPRNAFEDLLIEIKQSFKKVATNKKNMFKKRISLKIYDLSVSKMFLSTLFLCFVFFFV